MIRVERAPEPPGFDARVRVPGRRWLESSRKNLPGYWRRVLHELREAFQDRCAYTAMWLSAPGTVDHFVSRNEDRSLSYEWQNLRYAAAWVNSSKSALRASELLDPCEIGEDWFEIVLPLCQLRVTERCPEDLRGRAHFMLRRLGLDHGPNVLSFRQKIYEMYRKGLPLEEVEKLAPLIARAIRKEQAQSATSGRSRTE
jgi:hypothetical protein